MKQRALVNGASGFVGQRLVQVLAANGVAGIACSRRRVGLLPNGWQWVDRNAVLSQSASVHADVLIHLEVRQHSFRINEAERQLLKAVNVNGTRQWLQFAASSGIPHFVFLSSIKAVAPVSFPADEHSPGPGIGFYGDTKWRGEELVRRWTDADVRRSGLILRPAPVYGPGASANFGAMLKSISRGRFAVVSGGQNIKSLVSIENLCAALVHLLGIRVQGLDIFNIVDEESYSLKCIAEWLTEFLGRTPKVRSIPLWVARILAKCGDAALAAGSHRFPLNTSRLEGMLEHSHFTSGKLFATGFRPVESTREGLYRLARWYEASCQSQPT